MIQHILISNIIFLSLIIIFVRKVNRSRLQAIYLRLLDVHFLLTVGIYSYTVFSKKLVPLVVLND